VGRSGEASSGRAYVELENALRKRFPDLPYGFTLREGLARARPMAKGVDWGSVERELREYEEQRYGGGASGHTARVETIKLTKVLGRRRP
jgi:hypothetical protein